MALHDVTSSSRREWMRNSHASTFWTRWTPRLGVIFIVPALLLAACAGQGSSSSTNQATGPNPCLGNHQATQSTGSGDLGTASTGTPIPDSQPIHVNIALNVNYTALDACTAAIYNPASPAYGQYLTPAEIATNFAPSASDVAQLTTYLTGNGLQVTSSYLTNASITADGTAAQANKAFNVQLLATSANAYAPNKAPTLPSNLQNFVGSITGLNAGGSAHCNIDNPKNPAACGQISHYSHFTVPTNLPKTAPKSTKKTADGDCSFANYGVPLSGSLPTQQLLTWDKLQTAYGLDNLYKSIPNGINGVNTAIGLVEFDTYQRGDIVNYMLCAGTYAADRLQIVNVDVKSTDAAANSAPGAGEAELDLEMAAGLTGKNTKIYDYYAPNNLQWESELQDILQKVASDKKVSVLSISYGDFEKDLSPSYMDTINNSLKLLASEGISVFVASGDCAAYGSGQFGTLQLSFPASAPNAIAVGGTSIPADLLTGALGSESAWSNDSPTKTTCQNTWGSGGGLSQVSDFTLPAWQKGTGVSNQYSNGERQVPDVSGAAINISFYYDAGIGQPLWLGVGGTSAAAPIWAAGTAVLDQYLASKNKPPLGGVNALYTLANGSNGGANFNDITSGDNDAYTATKGWDFVTGWGSPHFDQIATTLGG